jgi:hypothetical protein
MRPLMGTVAQDASGGGERTWDEEEPGDDVPELNPAALVKFQVAELLIGGTMHLRLDEMGRFGHVITASTVLVIALETAFRHPEWARYWLEQWRLEGVNDGFVADELVQRFPVGGVEVRDGVD